MKCDVCGRENYIIPLEDDQCSSCGEKLHLCAACVCSDEVKCPKCGHLFIPGTV